jgi:hypothetical protein
MWIGRCGAWHHRLHRPRPSDADARARTLLQNQLRHVPKLGAQIEAVAEAVEIPERSLIVAGSSVFGGSRAGKDLSCRRRSRCRGVASADAHEAC